jgi:hypothetical protein
MSFDYVPFGFVLVRVRVRDLFVDLPSCVCVFSVNIFCSCGRRPPTPQLSPRFDLRATHARKFLPAALASMPFGLLLVRVRVRDLFVD